METSAQQRCIDWSISQGATVHGVVVSELPGRGNSLTVSRLDQHKSATPSITIPNRLLLTLPNIMQYASTEPAFDAIIREYSQRFSMTARRSIVLLMAYSRRYGSPWSPYLESLPSHVDSPIFWTSEERRLLEGTSIEGVAEDKIGFLQAWLDYQQGLPNASTFTKGLKLPELMLYEILVDSRALLSNEDDSCMVPVIDFANHSSLRPPSEGHQNAVWEMTDTAFELIVSDYAKDSDEILFSYGKRGNGELLFKYGFVEQWQIEKGSRSVTLEAELLQSTNNLGEPSFRLGSDKDDTVLENDDSPYLWLLVISREPEADLNALTFEGKPFKPRTLRKYLQSHRLWPLFQCKAVAIVLNHIDHQLERLDATEDDESLMMIANSMDDDKLSAINAVRDAERVLFTSQRERLMRLLDKLLSLGVVEDELARRETLT